MKQTKPKQRTKSREKFLSILVIVFSAFVGLCASLFAQSATDPLSAMGELLTTVARVSCAPLMIVILLVTVWFAITLHRCGKQIERAQQDDKVYAICRKQVSLVVAGFNVCQIVGLTLSSLVLNFGKELQFGWVVVSLVCFIVQMIWNFVLVNKAIRLNCVLDGQKPDSILTTSFHKKWLNACDEAELHQIHACAYRSFYFMNQVYAILMVLMVVLSTIQLVPPLVPFLVGGLYLTHVMSYTIPAYKIDSMDAIV